MRAVEADQAGSLPPRERGLKHTTPALAVGAVYVAPPAGAWIETSYTPSRFIFKMVAPPAGAWIETRKISTGSFSCGVAPPAGAWIETPIYKEVPKMIKSLPPRERGLKPRQLSHECSEPRRSPRGSVD